MIFLVLDKNTNHFCHHVAKDHSMTLNIEKLAFIIYTYGFSFSFLTNRFYKRFWRRSNQFQGENADRDEDVSMVHRQSGGSYTHQTKFDSTAHQLRDKPWKLVKSWFTDRKCQNIQSGDDFNVCLWCHKCIQPTEAALFELPALLVQWWLTHQNLKKKITGQFITVAWMLSGSKHGEHSHALNFINRFSSSYMSNDYHTAPSIT